MAIDIQAACRVYSSAAYLDSKEFVHAARDYLQTLKKTPYKTNEKVKLEFYLNELDTVTTTSSSYLYILAAIHELLYKDLEENN